LTAPFDVSADTFPPARSSSISSIERPSYRTNTIDLPSGEQSGW
jgi:hypothetical protein